MPELRKDYILPRWVIIAEKRKTRPREFKKEEQIKESKICAFCPGNEALTPKEIGRLEYKNSWFVRWFPNKFPFIEKKGKPDIKTKKYFTKADAYGYHEVIAETPEHNKQLSDLREEHIAEILKVYSLRIKDLLRKKGIKYVLVFKNHGRQAGTSLIHSHTQLTAYNKVPKLIEEEVRYSTKGKKCEYCKIIKLERKSKRFISENKNFIAFCPFASRYNYEAWVFPKKHIKSIVELNEDQLMDMAKMMKKLLVKIKDLDYNFCLHYAPKGTNLHFHIEICPRIAVWGGFELGSDTTINSVSPENAAKYYKK